MNINEQTLKQFSKDDLIKCIVRLSKIGNGSYLVQHELNNIVYENQRAKLSPLERASDDAGQNIKIFEKEMCEKYHISNFKECIKSLNLDERMKYLKLIQIHSDCLDREWREMDEQENDADYMLTTDE